MKYKFVLPVVFLLFFYVLASDEVSDHAKESKIGKDPVYVRAQFVPVATRSGEENQEKIKALEYRFNTDIGSYSGKTHALLSAHAQKYLDEGGIDIVYFRNDPSLNKMKSGFDPNKTSMDLVRSIAISFLFSLVGVGVMAAIFYLQDKKKNFGIKKASDQYKNI